MSDEWTEPAGRAGRSRENPPFLLAFSNFVSSKYGRFFSTNIPSFCQTELYHSILEWNVSQKNFAEYYREYLFEILQICR